MRATTFASVRAIAQTLLVVFLTLLSFAIPLAAQGTEAPKRVLLLFSYDSAVPSQVIAERALRETLKNNSPVPIEIFSEYQDSDRTPLENYEKELVGLLRRKYAGQKFDLIFAVSRPALSVLLKNRTELFPDTPIVFQALDQRHIAGLTLGANVTGLWGEANFQRNLELALELHPGTKKVVVVAGVNEADKYWTAKLQEEFRPYENRLEFIYQRGLTVSEQQKALASLSPHTIVFYLVTTRDNAGNNYPWPTVCNEGQRGPFLFV